MSNLPKSNLEIKAVVWRVGGGGTSLDAVELFLFLMTLPGIYASLRERLQWYSLLEKVLLWNSWKFYALSPQIY